MALFAENVRRNGRAGSGPCATGNAEIGLAITTILRGMVMMHSKSPLRSWHYCMFLMMTTTKAVSAKGIQQRLGMKRREPGWYMMQKIRLAMCISSNAIKLDGTVEFEVGFFRTEIRNKDPHQHIFNRGRGSERNRPVLCNSPIFRPEAL